MRPFLFYSPAFSIPSFAFSLMVASLVATWVSYKMAARRGLSQVAILDLAIFGTISAVIGIRLVHVVVEEPMYYLKNPLHIFQIWRGGFVSFGAFIGLALSWLIYLKVKKLDILRYLDHLCVFAAPFLIIIVRSLGCLMAGCCFGKPSPFDHFQYFLFIKFSHPSSDAGSLFPNVALFPTQVWATLYGIIIFLICYWVEGRQKFKGQVAATFLLTYSFFRFGLEFFRGDVSRGVYFGNHVSTGQIASGILFICGIILYFTLKKLYPMEHPYPRFSPKKAVASSSKKTEKNSSQTP